MCGALETVSHALNSCRYHVIIFDAPSKCSELPVVNGSTYTAQQLAASNGALIFTPGWNHDLGGTCSPLVYAQLPPEEGTGHV